MIQTCITSKGEKTCLLDASSSIASENKKEPKIELKNQSEKITIIKKKTCITTKKKLKPCK